MSPPAGIGKATALLFAKVRLARLATRIAPSLAPGRLTFGPSHSQAGANLLLLARRPAELKAVADECKAAWEAQPDSLTGGKGGRFTPVECDMSRREDIDRALATVQDEVDSVEVCVPGRVQWALALGD